MNLPGLRVVLLGWAVLCAGGCADSEREQELAKLVASGEAQLKARDASTALSIARSGLKRLGEDARLQLVAATACLQLERRSEAIAHADAGLLLDGDGGQLLEADVRANLHWARGTAAMARYQDLKDESDWTAANSSLEAALAGGEHRAEAAFLLVVLQDQGGHDNLPRQERHARLVIELAPDSEYAKHTRALMAAKGITL
ncbi:MAG: hypothetical protein ACT4PU_12050 [Planctomycetota bacterium]